MKQIIKQLLAVAILLSATFTSWAYDFRVNSIYYTKNSDGKTVYVTDGTYKYTGSVVIPSTVTYSGRTYSVTMIGYEAFRGCSGLTSVTIPNSVTEIRNWAFRGCSGLKQLVIQDGTSTLSLGYNNESATMGQGMFFDARLESVYLGRNLSYPTGYVWGYSPFFKKNTIKELTISNTVTSISFAAFAYCTGLKTVAIPSSVTTIDNCSFQECSGLTTIDIPSSVTSIGANAFSGTVWYNNQPDGLVYAGKVAYKYKGSMPENTSITLQDETLAIAGEAFKDCSGLTTVTIPNSVTNIGENAFSCCSGLTSVVFNAENCTTMGSSSNPVFSGCSELTSLIIGENVKSIPRYAFKDCYGLSSVIYNAENCTTMGSSSDPVFSGCSNLTSLIIGENVKSIPSYAFSDCTGLTSVIFEAENCTTTGSGVFSNCSNFSELTIGDNVKSIPNNAFSGCSGLTSVTIPNSVSSIGNYAFKGCSGLKQLVIQDGMSTLSLGYNYENPNADIGEGLFSDAPLESVYLGRNLSYDTSESRGYSPFYGKKTIKELTIGNSVTSIGYDAFNNCSGLTKVEISDIAAWCKISFGNLSSNPLYYAHHLYQNGKEVTNLVIPNSVTSICNYAFYGCSGLTSVTIGNSVTSIGGSAFSDCSGLTSVTIGNSVTSIGDSAFERCSGLTSVIYNAENCTTKSSIFSSCTNLTSLTIGDKVKSIPSSIFADCSGLTSVIIPNSVTSIGSSAFSGCSGLKSVTIPNSVTKIGYEAFYGCTGLTTIIVESGNTVYDSRENCNAIIETGSNTLIFGCQNTTIPNSVTSIGSSAFSGCGGLTSVTIPNSVTSIRNYAFYNCSGLTSVTIPNSVTSIGESAFYNCSGLTSVTIPNSVTSIGNYAFKNCSGLKQLTIQDGTSTLSLGYNFKSSSSVGRGLFYDAPLESVYLGRNLSYDTSKNRGYSPFYYKSTIKELTIGNSVTSIGANAFRDCSGLTSVTIGNSVSSIGEYAFAYCRNLEKVRFNATIRNVPTNNVFSSTKDLSFIVGEEVVSIPNNIVYNGGNGGVSKVIALADTPPTATSETFDSSVTSSATLYVKKNTVYKYFMADGWSDFANINTIDNLVTNISLDKTSVNLSLGETCKLNAIVEPAGATLTDLFWTASNSCVSVDQDGNVTGLSDGQCVVTAEAIDGTGIKAECVVNVGNIYAQSLRLSQETLALEVNGMAKLSCTILPGDTTIKTVEWSCSNESVATFNENADNTITVVGVESGVATITALTTDGSNLAALCTVYVGVTGAEFIDSDAVKVTSKGGAIRISGAAGAVAEVYSLSGMLLYCGTDSTIALPRGVYIVKVAGTTNKVML